VNGGLPAAWQAALRARADQPPRRPRVPLWAGASRIGSVEPDLLQEALPRAAIGAAGLVQPSTGGVAAGWQVNGELTATLGELALALRAAGVAHAWRDEQLAVTDDAGQVLGTVERAIVRPLGIITFAVHLIGFASDGRHWVQQRSLTKPNDPGLWDTLVGGMIAAGDSTERALERETWEEAGLRLDQLAELRHGGGLDISRPSGDGPHGYVVEHITWYRCLLPEGVLPANQDGEVAQFRLMPPDELCEALLREQFTLEAALIFVAAGLQPHRE
jgi:8-oxo-dGTP pyrophosphatase MutT (NUDIX family)